MERAQIPNDRLLAALHAAFQAAVDAPPAALDEKAEESDDAGEAPTSPRAAAANTLATLAGQARDVCWEIGDDQGEATCALLGDICFYVVDPVLRSRMLDLAGQCLAALESAQATASWAPGTVEGLRDRFDSIRPADDDAAAIARALGMSGEEASAFGLTGRITTVGLDEDEIEPAPVYADSDGEEGSEHAEQESLEMLFRRDAQALVATTMPRALQRYWQNQASLDALLEIRRAFHTLKGDAAVAARNSDAPDLPGLSPLAEAAEDVIDDLLGDDRDSANPAPALPAGAFGLLSETQAFLLKRLAARDALPGEEALLRRLHAMQAKARALSGHELVASDDPSARLGAPLGPVVEVSQAEDRSAAPGARRSSLDDQGVNTRLVSTFLSEADKLMPDLHRAVARLSSKPDDENALVRARVKLHTLKGGAALAGPSAVDIERLAHSCEDILEVIEDYQLNGSLTSVPAAVLTCVLDAEDALQSMLDGLRHPVAGRVDTQSPSALPGPDVDTLISRLRDVKAQAAAGELGADAAVTAADGHAHATPPLASDAAQGDGVAWPLPEGASVEPAGAAQVQGTSRPVGQLIPLVPLPTLVGATGLPTLLRGKDDARHSDPPRSMEDGDAIAPHDAAPTPESARENGLRRALRALEDQQVSRDALELLLQDMGVQAIESRRASARLRDLAERVEHELAGLRLELVRTTRRSGEWDALEKEEYTAIDVLLMQLDEALADQQEAETRLRRDLAEARAQNELQADALLQAQRALLDVSMVPLSRLEARLDHAVRSVARRVNKVVVFEMDGGEITLDGRVAEALFNPLMLLVNNALDHGLEEKESERTAAGKSAAGHIVVRGRTNGDSVTIAVGDDGRGIDPERVAAVAVSKGLVDAAHAASMTREERLALIWQPGFSTAKQVGAISGRGMGMKSVQDDIAALQGRIDVETEAGKGTTFTITLPRSLALMRVQVVREGRHLAAVPIADLASTHALPYNSLVEVPGGRVVRLGARTVVVYAARLGAGPAGDGANNQGILLEANGRGGGIVVDEVLYSQYVPVRPAPAYLRRSCGLIGYALGAGGVILPILDVATLIDRASTVAPLALRPGSDSPPGASPARQHTILVVDDSQTMRRALTQTFGRAGFVVREAVNGREALAALGRERPDVITLDMEMPEMDGLETLAALRLLPGGTSIPVFMITSRQQARHRAAALAAGVTRYFTKPYDDDEVVGAARLAIAGGLAASEVAS